MELLTLFGAVKVGIFFARLISLKEVDLSSLEDGIKVGDASNTFVSVEFSRSFV
jgi:hypothetical protein